MKTTIMKELIQKAIEKQSTIYEDLTTDDLNPQVIELANITKGKVEALSDILLAMEGNAVYLRMLADGK